MSCLPLYSPDPIQNDISSKTSKDGFKKWFQAEVFGSIEEIVSGNKLLFLE